MWDNQESVSAAVSGAHTKYNTPADHPRNYKPQENVYEVRPDEALFELKAMLFDYADAEAVIDFIGDVREFTAEYRTNVADAVRRLMAAREGESIVSGTAIPGQPTKRRKQYEAARNMASGGRPILVKESVFQLVPGVSSSYCSGVKQAVWRHGYWHVARSQVSC